MAGLVSPSWGAELCTGRRPLGTVQPPLARGTHTGRWPWGTQVDSSAQARSILPQDLPPGEGISSRCGREGHGVPRKLQNRSSWGDREGLMELWEG